MGDRMNECDGIYSIADSRINMCCAPLTGQTYDADFTTARFDVNDELLEHAEARPDLHSAPQRPRLLSRHLDCPKVRSRQDGNR